MFAFNQHGINAYAKINNETNVLAASPNKLIIMLYEGAIKACLSAIDYMQNKDIPNKGVMFSKAIMIIESGLRLSLNKKAGGEIAENLDALYAYMSKTLLSANIHNQPERVDEVIRLLRDLKSAWEAIASTPTLEAEIEAPIPSPVAKVVNRNIAHYAKV